jgi:hypothetical protein
MHCPVPTHAKHQVGCVQGTFIAAHSAACMTLVCSGFLCTSAAQTLTPPSPVVLELSLDPVQQTQRTYCWSRQA